MRNHKEQTVNLVKLLARHPVIVADIFEYGASGMLVPNIVEAINEYWGSDFERYSTKITEHYVWSLFHRRRPFHDARLYSQVKQENQEKVSARLYSTDPKFSLKDDINDFSLKNTIEETKQMMAEAGRRERLRCLIRVLETRQEYEDAKAEAEAKGLDIEAALNWIDTPLEVDND